MPVEDKDVGHVLIDLTLANNSNDFAHYNQARHTLMSSEDLVEGRLSFDLTHSGPISIYPDHLELAGLKTDSIGTTERGTGADQHTVFFWDLRTFVRENGYWETEGGRTVLLIPDAITDRATGEILKFQHVVEISNSRSVLDNNLGSFSNGILPQDNQNPEAHDDVASTSINNSVIIDVLANDLDPNNDMLIIDSFENPANGRAEILDDGRLLYTPDYDFTGSESFSYWATDLYGERASATITLDIWDM